MNLSAMSLILASVSVSIFSAAVKVSAQPETQPARPIALILTSSLPMIAQSVPSESVHDYCQRYAEDYAKRHQDSGALDGAARGAAGGAIIGVILGDPVGGAAAGAGIGAIGGGLSRSESKKALIQEAYDRCVREQEKR